MIASKIEWCDDTVNVVEGCTEVDGDCRNCYAKGIAARFSLPHQHRDEHGTPMGVAREGHYTGLAKLSPGRRLPQWTGQVRLRPEVLDAMFWRLLRARSPRRQFLCSMGDIFHAEVPDAFLDEVFARIAILESNAERGEDVHPIYMLTKRPERAAEYTNAPDVADRIEQAARAFIRRELEKIVHVKRGVQRARLVGFTMPAWPLRSVALITSAGTQAGADARVPWLLRCSAAIRGVSCEPMTGPVDFTRIECRGEQEMFSINALSGDIVSEGSSWASEAPRLDWVIAGGESGDLDATREELRPRPCELSWMEMVAEQAASENTPLFVKQLGNVLAAQLGREGKGGKPEDLPAHLRIRQFPRIPERP